MGVIAVYFFTRAQSAGGGFVAGLIFAVAILVQYMLAGTGGVESRLNLRPHRWLGFGLLLACATGLGRGGSAPSPPTPRTWSGRWWASCTCRAPSCSTSACSRWWSAPRC